MPRGTWYEEGARPQRARPFLMRREAYGRGPRSRSNSPSLAPSTNASHSALV